MHDGASTGGFTPSAYLGFVAADKADVVLDPLKGGALVIEAGVGETLFLHSVASEESIGAELQMSVVIEFIQALCT